MLRTRRNTGILLRQDRARNSGFAPPHTFLTWRQGSSFTRGLIFIFLMAILPVIANTDGYNWLAGRQQPGGGVYGNGDIALDWQATAEAIMAFDEAAEHSLADRASAAAWLSNVNHGSTEYLARLLMSGALSSSDAAVVRQQLLGRQGFDGGLGDQSGYGSTPFDTALALMALPKGSFPDNNLFDFFNYFLREDNSDGGFAYFDGESSPETTAYAVIALNPYTNFSQIADLVNAGKNNLLNRQESDGLWGDDQTSAIVLRALIITASDATALQSANDALATRQMADGSWSGDTWSTALALRTLNLFQQASTPGGGGPTGGTAALLGRVVQSGSSEPLEGATVALLSDSAFSTTTGADGAFLLSNVPTGPQTLVFSKSGYAVITTGLVVPPSGNFDVGDVALTAEPTSGVVQGTIFEDGLGLPIEGAILTLSGPDSVGATTDSNGGFSLSGVTPGAYQLSISATGYHTLEGSVSVFAGGVSNVNQGLVPISTPLVDGPGTLTGTVQNGDDGNPVAGATLSISGVGSTTTTADGSFALENVPRGSYTIMVSADGFQPRDYNLEFPVGASGNLGNLILYPGVVVEPPTTLTLLAQVVDGVSGQAVVGATVTVLETTGSAATDGNGTVTISDIPDLEFTAQVSADGYEDRSFTISSQGFGTVSVSLPIQPEGNAGATSSTISGVVTDMVTGLPISGASVSIENEGSAITGSDGSFTITDIAGFELLIQTTAGGYQTRLQTVSLPGFGNFDISMALEPIADPFFQVIDVTGPSGILETNQTAMFEAVIENLRSEEQTALVVVEVRSADDTVIANLQPYIPGTTSPASEFLFESDETLNLQIPWDTNLNAPGVYSIIVRVVEPGTISSGVPTGNVFAAGTTNAVMGETLAFDGGITFSPPLIQAGAQTPVQLFVFVRNSGNTALETGTYNLTLTNPDDNSVVHMTNTTGAALDPGSVTTLDFGTFTPQDPGNLQVLVSRTDIPDSTIAAEFYVGDLATGIFTVDRNEVPVGTQTVRGNITLTGVDTTIGTVVDPLFAAVRASVESGGEYVGQQSVAWDNSNGCLGCHTQTQSLTGLASSLDKGEIDIEPTRHMFNNIAHSRQTNHTLRLSHPQHSKVLTMLGAWSLGEWPNIDAWMRTRTLSLDYMYSRRSASGDRVWWTPDHTGVWYRFNEAMTSITAKSMVETILTAEDLEPNQIQTFASGDRQNLSTTYSQPRELITYNGFLYTVKSRGVIEKIDPVAGTSELITGDLGMGQGWGMAIDENDGTIYVAGDGGQVRVLDQDGNQLDSWSFGTGLLYDIIIGPDGFLYVSDWSNRRIIRFSRNGVGEVIASSGLINGPRSIQLSPEGDTMLVVNYYNYNVLEVTVDGDVSVYTQGFAYRPLNMGPNMDGIYHMTTEHGSGWAPTIMRADRSLEKLYVQNHPRSWARSNGAIYYTNSNENSLRTLNITPMDLETSFDDWRGIMPEIARYFLNAHQNSENENLQSAFRLIGLAEIRRITEDPALLAEIDAAMEFLENLLRDRQESNGGWARFASRDANCSDPQITAWVGIALDYTNPSPDDPMVRNAIQYLLNSQRSDGSWDNTCDRLASTRLASTSMVMVYMPKALERLGGLDVDLTVETAPDVDMTAFTVQPDSTETLPDGGHRHFWSLTGVTADGQSIEFDVTAHDMLLNEVRPAATITQMSFANSFTNEIITRDIPIPDITALSGLLLNVSTDQSNYGANEDVQITGAITTTSLEHPGGSLVLEIRPQGGTDVISSLPAISLDPIPAGNIISENTVWHTGTTLAGIYEVYGRVVDPDGGEAASDTALFTIVITGDNGVLVDAAVSTDKPVYGSWDDVFITSRVFNRALNAYLDPTLARLTVRNPSGAIVLDRTIAVPGMVPGGNQSFLDQLELVDAPEGIWPVTLDVFDASGTTQLATADASFEVVRDVLDGLTGQVVLSAAEWPQPGAIYQGEPLTRTDTVNNLSTTVAADVDVIRILFSMDTGLQVDEVTVPASIAADGSQVYDLTYNTSNLQPGIYGVVLAARTSNGTQNLANAQFTVLEAPATGVCTEIGNIGGIITAVNGDIIAGPNVIVNTFDACRCVDNGQFEEGGDLQAASGIVIDRDAHIAGNLYPNTTSDLVVLPVPDGLVSQGSLFVNGNETVTLPAGDHLFEDITIKSNGFVYTEGRSRIWFNGTLRIESNALLEPLDGKPASLMVLSTETTLAVDLITNARIISVLYAPNAPVTMGSNAELFGSLTGSSVDLLSNAIVHLDATLCDGCPEPPQPVPPIYGAATAAYRGIMHNDNARVDSYDGCAGPYDPNNPGSNGDLIAVENINISNNAILHGTAYPDTPSTETSMPIPEGLTNSGDLNVSGTLYLPAGDYLYNNINIQSNAHLVTGEGQTRIWFRGTMLIGGNGSARADSEQAHDLWFFGQCGGGDVLISDNNQGALFGVVHAPDQKVTILSNSRVYGAVVGSEIDIRSNAGLHYDESLAEGCGN